MPGRLLVVLLLIGAAASAEVVDRIVATVGRRVVTLSDVQNEQRMVCFLAGGEPTPATPARVRELAATLVDRILIRQEMDSGVFPAGPLEELDVAFLDSRLRFKSAAEYRAALLRCGASEKEVITYLDLRNQVSGFIDFRVLPGLQISPEEIQRYYDAVLVPSWRQRNEAPQPVDAVREKIAGLLAEQRKNERLDTWMAELHKQAEIRLR